VGIGDLEAQENELRNTSLGRRRETFFAISNEEEKELDRTCCSKEQFFENYDRSMDSE
jgi:hypothetical protein